MLNFPQDKAPKLLECTAEHVTSFRYWQDAAFFQCVQPVSVCFRVVLFICHTNFVIHSACYFSGVTSI